MTNTKEELGFMENLVKVHKYQYAFIVTCKDCGKKFFQILKNTTSIKCPYCESKNIERVKNE